MAAYGDLKIREPYYPVEKWSYSVGNLDKQFGAPDFEKRPYDQLPLWTLWLLHGASALIAQIPKARLNIFQNYLKQLLHQAMFHHGNSWVLPSSEEITTSSQPIRQIMVGHPGDQTKFHFPPNKKPEGHFVTQLWQQTVPQSPRYQLCFQYIVLLYVPPSNIKKKNMWIIDINSRAP